MKKALLIFGLPLAILACRSGGNSESEAIREERRVTVDSIFNAYFMPRGDGYTGGDGTYSILLPDGRTVWIWGDTFLGNVTDDYRRIKTDPLYIRNSFTFIKDDGLLETVHQGEPEEFKSMIIPPEVLAPGSEISELDQWYWPGDGFIENDHLKLFVSRFSQEEEGMWGFKFKGTEMVSFSLPDLKILEINTFTNLDSIHFGHAICPTSDYTYIYGLKDAFPYVARAKKGNIEGAWDFYSGNDNWVTNANAAIPMIEFSGSEQFSVFEWEEKYVMIMQEGGFGTGIYSFISDNPYGPWMNKKRVYTTPVPEDNSNIFTYNALAHPQFTEDNKLLISYNTNSMILQDHYDDALIYRPRFIRVPFELILY